MAIRREDLENAGRMSQPEIFKSKETNSIKTGKRGRPQKKIKREFQVKTYLPEHDKIALEQWCDTHGTDVSTMLRKLIVDFLFAEGGK